MYDNDLKIEQAADLIEKEQYKKALILLEPLIELQVAKAMALLGVMFQTGLGVEQNGPKAVELLLKAVESGDGSAAHNLGTIYSTGIPGIEKDLEKSKMYYSKAREMGVQFAPDSFYE